MLMMDVFIARDIVGFPSSDSCCTMTKEKVQNYYKSCRDWRVMASCCCACCSMGSLFATVALSPLPFFWANVGLGFCELCVCYVTSTCANRFREQNMRRIADELVHATLENLNYDDTGSQGSGTLDV